MSVRAEFKLDRGDFVLDVALDLPGRGVTALFGPSGSGKTTLLRLIAGLERAPGRLEVNGEVWQDDAKRVFVPTHRRALGYVFQEANLFPHLTARSNLEYGMKRLPQAARRVDVEHVIALLGIGHLLERKPERLSGGEKQRVAIARALATSPRVLLMDEPLAALDLARKQEILPYLERLHDELEIPVLYVSHAPDEVARLADHIVVIEGGRVAAHGPLGETLARLDLPIRLGEDAGVVLEGEIAEIDGAWHLARVASGGNSLWVRDSGLPVGRHVRVRILARDVSLALVPQTQSSILNCVNALVVDLATTNTPGQILVRLDVAGAPLLARITKRSANRLDIRPGLALRAQIKSVALLS